MASYKETRIDRVEYIPELRDNVPLAIDDMTLAMHLGIRNRTLWWIIRNKSKHYKMYKLPKRGKSGFRVIHDPVPALKVVQKIILARFLEPISSGKHVGAYVPGRSCRDVAEQHVKHGLILSLDIKNFFPSVKRSMIRRFLHRAVGYSHYVASLLADVMTVQDFVPQGAPTSGMIANLVADYRFDWQILNELKKHDPAWAYTRYSDDIDISHPQMQSKETIEGVLKLVDDVVTSAGFHLNVEKTKVEPFWRRQKVLGMIVNEKVNIPRYEFMRLRSLIHNCLVHGFDTQHARAGLKNVAALKSHISGKLAFFKQVEPVKTQRLKDKYDLACSVHSAGDPRNRLEVSFDE